MRLSSRTVDELKHALLDQFGFDLSPVIEHQALTFWKRMSAYRLCLKSSWNVLVIPRHQLRDGSGILINAKFQPSHEWAARFRRAVYRCRMTLPTDQAVGWLKAAMLTYRFRASCTRQRGLFGEYDGQFMGGANCWQGGSRTCCRAGCA